MAELLDSLKALLEFLQPALAALLGGLLAQWGMKRTFSHQSSENALQRVADHERNRRELILRSGARLAQSIANKGQRLLKLEDALRLGRPDEAIGLLKDIIEAEASSEDEPIFYSIIQPDYAELLREGASTARKAKARAIQLTAERKQKTEVVEGAMQLASSIHFGLAAVVESVMRAEYFGEELDAPLLPEIPT